MEKNTSLDRALLGHSFQLLLRRQQVGLKHMSPRQKTRPTRWQEDRYMYVHKSYYNML